MASTSVPPQDRLVQLAYAGEQEAGRFAVAKQRLSPGQRVLTAAPYALTFNPNEFVSALYLAVKANTSATVAAEGDGGGSASASASPSSPGRKKASCTKTKKVERGKPSSNAFPSLTAMEDGEREVGAAGAATTTTTTTTTTAHTYCSGCFRRIPPGSRLINHAALRELAVDLSIEQEAHEEELLRLRLRQQQEQHASECEEGARETDQSQRIGEGVAAGGDDDHEEGGDATASARVTAAALKKLKKPSKSAKMRKDGAVELKQKLRDMAVAQREIALCEHRQKKARRAAAAAAAGENESPPFEDCMGGWEKLSGHSADACTSNASTGLGHDAHSSSPFVPSEQVTPSEVAGCTGCGVVCYCSPRCWYENRQRHRGSGECAVLRWVYPRIMAEYYAATATSTDHAKAATGGAIVMPGEEPARWTRSTSEERCLEAQALLLAALVLGQSAKHGYQSHWTADPPPPSPPAAIAVSSSSPSTVTGDAKNRGEATATTSSDAENAGVTEAREVAARSAHPRALPSARVLVDSDVAPKEVLSMQETRAKLGLTGSVEVLDGDSALRVEAEAAPSTSLLWIRCRDNDSGLRCAEKGGSSSCSDAVGDGCSVSTVALRPIRIPRYADMAQMITNLSVLSKDRKGLYGRYYRRFLRVVAPWMPMKSLQPELSGASDAAQSPSPSSVTTQAHAGDDTVSSSPLLSESFFLRISAAAQCNSFGIYTADDRCLAFGVYPEASYFNHSCVPNLCRCMHEGGRSAAFYAIRPIEPGEPLTICYTDVHEKNSAERRRNLLGTYRFYCQCTRCAGSAGVVDGTEESKDGYLATVQLCTNCAIKGYLRPVAPMSEAVQRKDGVTWGMDAISLRVCSVCGTRVEVKTKSAS